MRNTYEISHFVLPQDLQFCHRMREYVNAEIDDAAVHMDESDVHTRHLKDTNSMPLPNALLVKLFVNDGRLVFIYGNHPSSP